MSKFEKYGWLNHAPDQLKKNLQAQIETIRQPGDEAAFARLRGSCDSREKPDGQTAPEKTVRSKRGGQA